MYFLVMFQVHVFYRKCGNIASCNCAVAARAGDDVFIIDKCGPSAQNTLGFYPLTVRLFRNGLLTPGFKLLSRFEGREHKVLMHRSILALHCKVLPSSAGSGVVFVLKLKWGLFCCIKAVLIHDVPCLHCNYLYSCRVIFTPAFYILITFYHSVVENSGQVAKVRQQKQQY